MRASAKQRRKVVCRLMQEGDSAKDIVNKMHLPLLVIENDIKWLNARRRHIVHCGGRLIRRIR